MKIYIDEAGNFVVPQNRLYSISLVLALVIPSTQEANLLAAFRNVRKRWTGGKDVEVKGSSIDEMQAAKIVDMLSGYDVLVDCCAIDMVTHTDKVIDEFKARQAAAITAHLTQAHSPNIADYLQNLSETVRRTPNQLFVQAFITMLLVFEMVQTATLYYVQRSPKELGDIAWIVDRKDRTLTEMEKMWSRLILPIGEGHFARKPLGNLVGADYSYFDLKYGIDYKNESEMKHLEWVREVHRIKKSPNEVRAVNSKRLISEQLEFAESHDHLGLQLVDIVASILRRACNGHLKLSGWADLGKLMIRKKAPRFAALGKNDIGINADARLRIVLQRLERTHKSMTVADADERFGNGTRKRT